ncbi:3'-5' exonuclease [Roseomonas aeriglobus]|nr:3'-5' exonuclease [Roseomonas aeriglobus]
MRDEDLAEAVLRVIEGSDDFRLLRRLKLPAGQTGAGSLEATRVGIAIDTETTGLGPDDRIIELAVRRFRFDEDGVIVAIDQPYSWLEDPGRPLDPDVSRLTGLVDAELAGQALDEEAAMKLLRSAEFVVAHNAGFDRKVLERRLPQAAGLAWACSCAEVDWRAAGFEGGRSLGWLLVQIHRFHGAHRAGDDVDALIALLRHELPTGRTALAEMLESARAPSWRFRAVGAAFDAKDALKARGYRWDGERRCWWREVANGARDAESEWLEVHVYSGGAGGTETGPFVERITWRERYA